MRRPEKELDGKEGRFGIGITDLLDTDEKKERKSDASS